MLTGSGDTAMLRREALLLELPGAFAEATSLEALLQRVLERAAYTVQAWRGAGAAAKGT